MAFLFEKLEVHQKVVVCGMLYTGLEMNSSLPLLVAPDLFGMIKLSPAEPIPESILRASPCFVARTDDELSIVAPLEVITAIGPSAGRFRLIRIALAFGMTESGILKRIADPFAAAGVWILALGTHDTDYVLIREEQFQRAIAALKNAGHQIISA